MKKRGENPLNKLSLQGTDYLCVMSFRDRFNKYYPYFVDVWQYLVIILIFIIAAIFIL